MDKKRAEQATAWVLVALGALAALAGVFFNLYNQFHWYDEIIHAYNFFALTLLVAVYAYGVVLTGGAGTRLSPSSRRGSLRAGARRFMGDGGVCLRPLHREA